MELIIVLVLFALTVAAWFFLPGSLEQSEITHAEAVPSVSAGRTA